MPSTAPLSLIEARDAIRRREISCAEYALELSERHAKWRHVNGFAYFDETHLLSHAIRCDKELAITRQPRSLLGIPIAIKDNIDTAFMPTGNGTMAMRTLVPPQNAPVIASLLKNGAIVAGKANMHELAFGATSNNRVMGAVRNPYAVERIPGGSSGGSAVLVSAGVVPAALGTDTGGSVRVPAALCGVVGLRPTSGRYPNAGVAPISRTRDTVGPIARTVADVALLDSILTGAAAPLDKQYRTQPIRLGVPRTTFWKGLSHDVESVAGEALDKLEKAGFELIEVDLNSYPGFFDSEVATIAMYEFRSTMSDYLHSNGYDLNVDDIIAGIGSPDVAAIARRICGPKGISEQAYDAALENRHRSRAAYARCLQDTRADALIFPTTVATACPISESETTILNGESLATFPTFIRNTEPGSNAGVPGMTIPAGLSPNGLPVGLALDGAIGNDRHLIAICIEIEQVLGQLPRPNPHYGLVD